VNPVPIPTIDKFAPGMGSVGAKLYLTGTNLNWTTKVTFNGKAASFIIIRPTELLLTVPAGATTGKIEITTLGGVALSLTDFVVVPSSTISNDYLANAIVLVGKSVFASSVNSFASREFGEYYYGAGETVWYRWRAPATGIYAFNTAGSNFDTEIFVFTGPVIPLIPTELSIIDQDDDSGPNFTGVVSLSVTKGTDYFVSVDRSYYSFYSSFQNFALGIYPTYAWSSVAGDRFDGRKTLSLGEASDWQVQGTAAGVEPASEPEQGQAAFVGGSGADSHATIAWLKSDGVAPGSAVSASVDLSVDTELGTPELFSWTLFDKSGTSTFALSFDAATGSILSQIAGQEASPTGQVFLPGAKYQLTLEADYGPGTWGAMLNGSWIIENQALPASAITSGFGDVGAVWVPAPGATSGGKMHFDNLSIESRPSAK
jgi:hypothetical protein